MSFQPLEKLDLHKFELGSLQEVDLETPYPAQITSHSYLYLPRYDPARLPLYPHRYEEEINRRTAAENEFVVLKKVGETGGTTDAELTLTVAQAGNVLTDGRCHGPASSSHPLKAAI